jgi:hypothetical protein
MFDVPRYRKRREALLVFELYAEASRDLCDMLEVPCSEVLPKWWSKGWSRRANGSDPWDASWLRHLEKFVRQKQHEHTTNCTKSHALKTSPAIFRSPHLHLTPNHCLV